MKALLDTHVLLWWTSRSELLSERVRSLFLDGGNQLFWSAAGSWELAIKVALGSLQLPAPVRTFVPRVLREQGMTPLPIEHSHAFQVAELPSHHRDPFDRMLVAQAMVEGLPLVTADREIGIYDVEVLW